MQISKPGWLTILTLALFFIPLTAQAQLVAGRDYAIIQPALPTDNPKKIEVIEFFSYGCPHCSELHPHANKWAAKLPVDVAFKRVPVGFGSPYYQNVAKLYYALEAIGELTRLDNLVFHAIHEKGLKLIDDQSILEWVTSQGVDAKTFSDAYNSFSVVSKAKRADQLVQSYTIRGVPALAVGGRYLMLNDNIRSHAELLSNTDMMIKKARSDRKLKNK